MAMLLGAGPPLEFLSADLDDWRIQTAVVRRASELDAERRRAEIDALAKHTGSAVAAGIARIIRRLLRG